MTRNTPIYLKTKHLHISSIYLFIKIQETILLFKTRTLYLVILHMKSNQSMGRIKVPSDLHNDIRSLNPLVTSRREMVGFVDTAR
jgi:hypothetical protein